jgi:hypothetical protein
MWSANKIHVADLRVSAPFLSKFMCNDVWSSRCTTNLQLTEFASRKSVTYCRSDTTHYPMDG